MKRTLSRPRTAGSRLIASPTRLMRRMISLATRYEGAALPAKRNVRGGKVAPPSRRRLYRMMMCSTLRIDRLVQSLLRPSAEALLGRALGCKESVTEGRILSERPQEGELARIRDPVLSNRLGNQRRERRVGFEQPSTLRNAVGNVAKALRIELGEVSHRAAAQKRGVNRRDAIRAVRSDNRKVRHPHLLDGTLLDEAHALRASFIPGIAPPNLAQETAIDLINDFEMPGQGHLEERDGPPLERLRQKRVIRVGERALRDIPGLLPAEAGLVEQNPHELGDRKRRMGVIQLNGHLLGK